LTLPTATRLVREGADIVREFHPRDLWARVTGHLVDEPNQPSAEQDPNAPLTPVSTEEVRTEAAEHPSSTPTAAGEPVAPAEADGTKRSDAAKIAMMIGLGGGFAQNAIDVV